MTISRMDREGNLLLEKELVTGEIYTSEEGVVYFTGVTLEGECWYVALEKGEWEQATRHGPPPEFGVEI